MTVCRTPSPSKFWAQFFVQEFAKNVLEKNKSWLFEYNKEYQHTEIETLFKKDF